MQLFEKGMCALLALFFVAADANAAEPVITPGKKSLPLPGEAFQLDGHEAFVILPENAGGDVPWVWYAPTLRGLPSKSEGWMFERFLKAGIAIAGIDVGESYGSPTGRGIYDSFYQHLVTTRKFGKKPLLLARSRGGLMLYNWAVENPQSVGGVAGIYPVCSIASYPGIKKAAGAYKMRVEELEAKLTEHNPIDRLEPLAKAKVPVFHIHGDRDKVVPLEANSAELVKRYKALGGPAEIEVIAGQGHNMWKGWFESQALTDFVIKHAKVAAKAGGLGAALEKLKLPGVKINLEERAVDVESVICLRTGGLELIACTKDTKEHESIIMVNTKAKYIHTALLLLGAKAGSPAMRKMVEEGGGRWIDLPPRGAAVDVFLVIADQEGKLIERPISDFIMRNSDRAGSGNGADEEAVKFPTNTFVFAGSHLHGQGDAPRKYLADGSGNVISLSTFGDEVLCLPDVHGHANGGLMWEVDSTHLPALETKVTLRLRPRVAAGTGK